MAGVAPERTGNKLHPVQLGLITVALTLLSLAAARFLARHDHGLV